MWTTTTTSTSTPLTPQLLMLLQLLPLQLLVLTANYGLYINYMYKCSGDDVCLFCICRRDWRPRYMVWQSAIHWRHCVNSLNKVSWHENLQCSEIVREVNFISFPLSRWLDYGGEEGSSHVIFFIMLSYTDDFSVWDNNYWYLTWRTC